MLEMIMASALTPPILLPQGQVSFTTPGTYQWTCPEGVTSVCSVVIGAGTYSAFSGGAYMGGNGGALRYMNDIPVIPGNVYTIVVGNTSGSSDTLTHRSSAFNIYAGSLSDATARTTTIKGGDGNGGYNGSGASGGGGAGTYQGGMAPSNQVYGGGGCTLYGTVTAIGTQFAAMQFGGGGGYRGMAGATGGVRIIWGSGRAFPTTKVQDL